MAAIKALDGTVFYDFEMDQNGHIRDLQDHTPGPAWLRNLVGIDYFANVVAVGVVDPNGVVVGAVAELPGLLNLGLGDATATDAEWKSLDHLRNLRVLGITGSCVVDSTLGHIKGSTHLRELDLEGAGITDAGVESLIGLTELKRIILVKTKVTAKGVQDLKHAAAEP